VDRTRFDVLVIGGGQAGIPLAWALASHGRTVALAERKWLGGSCVNFGCTPTKAAVASAALAHQARRARDYGLDIPEVRVDFAAVIRRARAIAGESRSGLERGFAGSANPLLLNGHARFTGRAGQDFVVRVGEREVLAGQVVIDTGTRAMIPDTPGLASLPLLHAGNWLDVLEPPAHLVMLGAGVIALEMSQFYRRMGCRVTLLARGDRLAGREDGDVAQAILDQFRAEGIDVRLNTAIERADRGGAGIALAIRGPAGAETLHASHVFVATGRRMNTDDLGLETIGLTANRDGTLPVDARLATPVAGVWAAGDIRGGPMFTHTSWDDYRILLSQMAGDGARTTARIVPYAIFTDPEIGRVGVGEDELRAKGLDAEVLRFDLARSGRAREMGSSSGFIKVIVERGSRKILGATVVGPQAAELVHMYVDVMNAGASASVIRDAVHIHPTLAEAVQSAVT
jgi:pyruvate/2-oxoglutarate dehydrogenase complex dihydrolipoamide dehydrogenase (E3) component